VFVPIDAAEVYYDIRVTSAEQVTLADSAVVGLIITPAASDVLIGTDAFTVYIDIQPSSFEYQIIPALVGIFYIVAFAPRWFITAEPRWQAVGIVQRWRLDKIMPRWFYWASAPRAKVE
jgi:hypothetical protein